MAADTVKPRPAYLMSVCFLPVSFIKRQGKKKGINKPRQAHSRYSQPENPARALLFQRFCQKNSAAYHKTHTAQIKKSPHPSLLPENAVPVIKGEKIPYQPASPSQCPSCAKPAIPRAPGPPWQDITHPHMARRTLQNPSSPARFSRSSRRFIEKPSV